jgi:hypothetical protein
MQGKGNARCSVAVDCCVIVKVNLFFDLSYRHLLVFFKHFLDVSGRLEKQKGAILRPRQSFPADTFVSTIKQ